VVIVPANMDMISELASRITAMLIGTKIYLAMPFVSARTGYILSVYLAYPFSTFHRALGFLQATH
jgi:hypothetical protein